MIFKIFQHSTDIISVGGNDISNGPNVEYVEEKYDQLLQYIKNANTDLNVVLCTACPRQDCSVTDLNDIIKCPSDEYGAQLVEMEKYFVILRDNQYYVTLKRIKFPNQNLESANCWTVLRNFVVQVLLTRTLNRAFMADHHKTRFSTEA